MKFLNIIIRFLFCFLLFSCSTWEKSEDNKIRAQNAKGEYIYRKKTDQFFVLAPIVPKKRKAYPWEVEAGLDIAKVTKHHFRCKGSPLNPPYTNQDKFIEDCKGSFQHGLPFIGDTEGVYPVLVDLLNYVQSKTKKEVIITSGHRCPDHNTYCDPSKKNLVSKHQIGAEVDFYVKGLEEDPNQVIQHIIAYYRGDKFFRYSGKIDVETLPWYNKEIFLKLYQSHEGRDFDNQHQYPYISIQVRYDKNLEEKVTYSWEKAHKRYKKTF